MEVGKGDEHMNACDQRLWFDLDSRSGRHFGIFDEDWIIKYTIVCGAITKTRSLKNRYIKNERKKGRSRDFWGFVDIQML